MAKNGTQPGRLALVRASNRAAASSERGSAPLPSPAMLMTGRQACFRCRLMPLGLVLASTTSPWPLQCRPTGIVLAVKS